MKIRPTDVALKLNYQNFGFKPDEKMNLSFDLSSKKIAKSIDFRKELNNL
jgi:hypothetical protein